MHQLRALRREPLRERANLLLADCADQSPNRAPRAAPRCGEKPGSSAVRGRVVNSMLASANDERGRAPLAAERAQLAAERARG